MDWVAEAAAYQEVVELARERGCVIEALMTQPPTDLRLLRESALGEVPGLSGRRFELVARFELPSEAMEWLRTKDMTK